MNGCELPGGVVLNVEPSDPLHKQRNKDKSGHGADLSHREQSGTTTGHENENQDQGPEIENEDDLDDFFASLE